MTAMSESPLRVDTTCTCSVTSWHVAIPVTRHTCRNSALAAGERSDVVASPALELHHGTARRPEVLNHRELRAGPGPSGRAAPCIGGASPCAPRVPCRTRRDHARRRNSSTIFKNMLREAEHRVGGSAVRSVTGRNGVERAVHQGVAVDDGDVWRLGCVLCMCAVLSFRGWSRRRYLRYSLRDFAPLRRAPGKWSPKHGDCDE